MIKKTALALLVGASLDVTEGASRSMRGEQPFVFSNMKTGQGLTEIIAFIESNGLFQMKTESANQTAMGSGL